MNDASCLGANVLGEAYCPLSQVLPGWSEGLFLIKKKKKKKMLNTNMGRSVLCDQQKILFCFILILLLFFQGLPLNRMNITSG